MNRRQSLVCLSALAGQALFPQVLEQFALASSTLAQDSAVWKPAVLTPQQGRVLAEVVDTIIPETDTPGAKAARVHVFVDLMLAHCVPATERDALVLAIDGIDGSFLRAAAPEREARIVRMDEKLLTLLKELTLLGYFTSEVGVTRALAYAAVPGEYRGCIELKPGQRGEQQLRCDRGRVRH